jgi:hypothetical protein
LQSPRPFQLVKRYVEGQQSKKILLPAVAVVPGPSFVELKLLAYELLACYCHSGLKFCEKPSTPDTSQDSPVLV